MGGSKSPEKNSYFWRFAVIKSVAVAEIRAHITGTVWKVLVSRGDAVTEEQTVVVLESMKMEMPVESPSEGLVVTIHVEEGQAVEDGDLLITLG